MSEQDQLQREDAALGKATRLKWNRNHANQAILDVASQMEDVAKWLKEGRRDFSADWLDKDRLALLWNDLDKADGELRQAEQVLSSLGIPVPY